MDDSTYQQQNNYPSSTGSDSYAQGPGAGTNSQQFSQGQGGGYDNVQQSGQDDMGGGQGAMGSGVAGGYEGNSQNTQNTQNTGQGQQDWLDKGIESAGQKAGFNVSNQQADSVGDFINKEAKQYLGRNVPGVN